MTQPSRATLAQLLLNYVQVYQPDKRHERLIDDLLALWSPPDRAGLLKIFKDHEALTGEYPLTVYAKTNDRFIDALLTWAGSPPASTWCSHLTMFEGNWVFNYYSGGRYRVPFEWDQCPVAGCHASRPASGA